MSTKKQFYSKENNYTLYRSYNSSPQQHYSMTAFLKMHDKFYNLFPNGKELSTTDNFSLKIENLLSEIINIKVIDQYNNEPPEAGEKFQFYGKFISKLTHK